MLPVQRKKQPPAARCTLFETVACRMAGQFVLIQGERALPAATLY